MSLCRDERRPENPFLRRRLPGQPPTPPDPNLPRRAPPCAAELPATGAAHLEAAVAVAGIPALPPFFQALGLRRMETRMEERDRADGGTGGRHDFG